jgi:hypothetical protein
MAQEMRERLARVTLINQRSRLPPIQASTNRANCVALACARIAVTCVTPNLSITQRSSRQLLYWYFK